MTLRQAAPDQDPLVETRERVGDRGGFFLSPQGRANHAWLRACRNPVGKALWFIESRLSTNISLDDVAAVAGVSRYHLARAFEFATGQPLVRYIRGRRLGLVEPVRAETRTVPIEPPRFMEGEALRIAGVPSPWPQILPAVGKFEGQVGNSTFGVRCNHDDAGNYDYLSGFEVADFTGLPLELHRLWIPAQRYAVFTHRGHICELRNVWHTIWSQWLPESGYETVEAPDFECYDGKVDPRAGPGRVELWVPIRR